MKNFAILRRIQRIYPFLVKHGMFIGTIAILLGITFLLPETAHAQGATTKLFSYIVSFLSWIVYTLIIYPVGWFVVFCFGILIEFARYNDFVNATAVIKGWVIVRDLANMAIIIVLLVIAFGIMFQVERFGNRKALGKLLIAALLINFSKTICGIFIDISQIVMLTFVNGFQNIAGVSLVESLQLRKFMTYNESLAKQPAQRDSGGALLKVLAGIVLAAGFMITILTVIVVIIMTLVMRIVMLWILVILSPIAFLFMLAPFGNGFAGQWQKKFTAYLINGPLLAFFLWLSLAIMNGISKDLGAVQGAPALGATSGNTGFFQAQGQGIGNALSDALTAPNVMTLIISIGLLVASLIISQEFAAVGAKSGLSKSFGIAKAAIKGAAKYTAKGVDGSVSYLSTRAIGRDLSVGNFARNVKRGAQLQADRFREGLATSRRQALAGDTWVGRVTGNGLTQRQEQAIEDRDQAQSEVKVGEYGEALTRQKRLERLQHLESKGLDITPAENAEAAELRQSFRIDVGEVSGVLDEAKRISEEAKAKVTDEEARDTVEQYANEFDVTQGNFGEKMQLFQNDVAGEFGFTSFAGLRQDAAERLGRAEATISDVDSEIAKKKTTYEYILAKKAESELATKRTERIKGDYHGLDDASEIANILEGVIQSISSKDDSENISRAQYLIKTASEQGMLKNMMKSMNLKPNQDDFQTLIKSAHGLELDNNDVTAGMKGLVEQVQKESFSKGVYGLSNQVITDTDTGKARWQTKDEHEKELVGALNKGKISGTDRTELITQKGSDASGAEVDVLNDIGVEYIVQDADSLKKKVDRGTIDVTTRTAIKNSASQLRAKAAPDQQGFVEELIKSVEGYAGKGAQSVTPEQLQKDLDKLADEEEKVFNKFKKYDENTNRTPDEDRLHGMFKDRLERIRKESADKEAMRASQ